MSTSPGPWRLGGQSHFDGDKFVELKSGRTIWNAEGEPVFEMKDWFCKEDLDLIASAPTLAADLAEAVKLLREHEKTDMRPVSAHRRCASCFAVIGHVEDCKLAAFLARVDAR